jgi:transposase
VGDFEVAAGGREIRHEPEDTQCSCGCTLERIGEDVSEKLDYTPGVFHVERHTRGKWVCRGCERLIQAPVAPHIIDKGIPTTGLLAQVLIAKYLECRYRHSRYHAASGTMPQNSVESSKTGVFTRVYSVERSA